MAEEICIKTDKAFPSNILPSVEVYITPDQPDTLRVRIYGQRVMQIYTTEEIEQPK